MLLYGHQIQTAGLSRGDDSFKTNNAAAEDVIKLRTRDFEKPLLLDFSKGYDYQIWTAGSVTETT